MEGKEVDQRSDIYSLGVILYEMVTGQVPFEGDTPFTIGMKHKGETPQDPKNLNAQIHEDLNSLILKCLQKEKDQRYQSAGEVRSELEKIEQGLPTTERIVAKKKPTSSREITVKLSLGKHFKWGLIFAAIVVIGIIIWQLLPKKAAVSAPKIENSIAVISFENQTGDQGYDYLQKAIPNLLISDLEQTGGFYVATWERMGDILDQMGQKGVDIIDTDLGFEICRREGIQSIVTGSFVKAGDTFVTDVKILDVETKKMLKSATSQGKGENSILDSQIDELGREIFLGLGMARQELESTLQPISELTTSSMEAYKYYLQGKDEIQNLDAMRARQSLEKAVELDPQFAMAFLFLSRAYGEMANRDASFEALNNAKAHSERATEKERLFIEAEFASAVERDSNKRFRILNELANKYPKEKDAHYELGFYYRGKGRYKESALEYQKSLALDPNYGPALNMLAYTYADLGDYTKAIETFEKYAVAKPEDANPLDSMAELYFRMGDLDRALAKYKKTLEVDPNFGCESRLAYIYALKQEYAETMKQIDRYTTRAGSAGIKAAGYIWMAMYDYLVGKIDKAFEDLRQGEVWSEKAGNDLLKGFSCATGGWMYFELSDLERSEEHMRMAFDIFFVLFPDLKSLRASHNFDLGLVDLKRGKIESAKAMLKKIKSIVALLSDKGSLRRKTESQVAYDWLHAEILIAEGSPDQAIEIFENIVYPPIPTMHLEFIGPDNWPFIRDTLPRAYLKMGDIDGAIAEYERMIVFDPEGQDRLLIHPVYRYKLAKLYEEKGEVGKAIEQYEAFLELWKDADPGLPEVEEAKKRLTSLQSN